MDRYYMFLVVMRNVSYKCGSTNAITQEGTLSNERWAKSAEEITRIHTTVVKLPKNLSAWSSSRIRREQDLLVESRRPYGLAQMCTARRASPR
jgi:hypothetical protein